MTVEFSAGMSSFSGKKRRRESEETAAQKRFEQLQCSICLDIFDDPISLPACGHTFCRTCISNVQSKKCPLCDKAGEEAQTVVLIPIEDIELTQ